VSKALQAEAAERKFRVFDATCPLVTKVHVEVAKLRRDGVEIIMIGHEGHPEVEGTMGQATGDLSGRGRGGRAATGRQVRCGTLQSWRSSPNHAVG
jgi:4-hydroxy-3-methylbut-2-enyl diphosphate reductase IspH